MIDSIYIALSGLRGYQTGLRVISNNASNLNTPGFKSSSLQFGDLYYSGGNVGGGTQASGQYGYGLSTLGTSFDFHQGQLQSTGKDLDLAVDGQGFFVLRDADGKVHYTRDGQFAFNNDGVLVSTATGEEVMAFAGDGALGPISVAALRENAAKATANITFQGNLSSTATSAIVDTVSVIDGAGSSHTLSVRLEAASDSPGTWNVTVLDGTTTVGTGQIAFVNGQPDPERSKVSVTYTPAGRSPCPLTLDFSSDVTSYDSGSRSTVTMASQDGQAAGSLVGTKFGEDGVLSLSYSNGQTVEGPRLALATFTSPDAIGSIGANEFEAKDPRAWRTGAAGDSGLGSVSAGMVESSNVDLSQEFSDLIIMQRGYQASSQVISTVNEMLAELFAMRGSR
jgi:flagellar hook protein FlgE